MSTELVAGNVHTFWFIRLYYDAGSKYITVSHEAATLFSAAEKVLPFLQNEPTIRRSLDLKECTADVSNVTLDLSNSLYRGAPFWEEVEPFGATRKYLNRAAVIWEKVNNNTAVERFSGRIRDIKLNRKSGKVTIVLEPNQPWDFLSIPQVQTKHTGRYYPIIYGLYTPNASTQTTRALCGQVDLWPAEVDRVSQDYILALAHQSGITDGRLHIHEEGTRQLVPLTDSGASYNDTSETYENGNAIKADAGYYQGWIFKPTEYGGTSTIDFTTPEAAHDFPLAEDSVTSAKDTLTATGGGGDSGDLYLGIPLVNKPGSQTSTTVKVKVRWSAVTISGSGTPSADTIVLTSSDSSVGGTIASLVIDGGAQTSTLTGTMDSSGDLPTWIKLVANLGFLSPGTSLTVQVKIFDVTYECATEVEAAGDSGARQETKAVDTVYCGADGLPRSWSSGACDEVQEIHRDMLIRYAGMSTGTPDGYTDLDTARSGWSGRLWLHKPVELQEVLEQLQFEGQFVFTYAEDGSPLYIFVESSYSASDVDFTIVEDIDTAGGVDYSHTPLTELVTQQEIKYERHPADDRYISSETYTNSAARSAWDIQTKENIETTELDYLVAEVDTVTTGFTRVRDQVYGDIKEIISCRLTRPRAWGVTLGSIVKVDGDSNYYLVTSEQRSRSGVSIKARKVG